MGGCRIFYTDLLQWLDRRLYTGVLANWLDKRLYTDVLASWLDKRLYTDVHVPSVSNTGRVAKDKGEKRMFPDLSTPMECG